MNLVSVIIPYYKKKKYFERTLNSILSQSYKKIEIIIIYDDTDLQELTFLKKITKKSKRISIIVNRKNLGAGPSRNIGINASKGKFIAFIDADDIWRKDKIYQQIKSMKKNRYQISHTSYEIINHNNKKISQRIAKHLDFINLSKSCDIGLSTVILEKKLIKNKIKFPNLKTKEDFVLWLKIASKGTIIYAIDKNLTKWRKAPKSLSSSVIRKLIDGYMVYRKYLKYNVFKSVYFLIILSFNFLKKV